MYTNKYVRNSMDKNYSGDDDSSNSSRSSTKVVVDACASKEGGSCLPASLECSRTDNFLRTTSLVDLYHWVPWIWR